MFYVLKCEKLNAHLPTDSVLLVLLVIFLKNSLKSKRVTN